MRNKTLTIYFFATVFFIFTACKRHNSQWTEAEKIVNEWTGKTIAFPADIPYLYLLTDSVVKEKKEGASYKILLYIDSVGCVSCRLNLLDWRSIIQEADSLFSDSVEFLFYFQPQDIRELKLLFKHNQFEYPIYLDKSNKINDLNKFPRNVNFQCFLLDEYNKMLLMGNPSLNPSIWDLYKQTISGKGSAPRNGNEPITTIEVKQTEIEIIDTKLHKTSVATFVFTNTGNNFFQIKDISASCGCIISEWDKKPIKPGDKTEVKVKITPDTSGYFRKSITVFSNIEEGATSLIIKSTVKE